VRGQNAACSHVRPLVEGPTHVGPSTLWFSLWSDCEATRGIWGRGAGVEAR
jgi:hypothetical protein